MEPTALILVALIPTPRDLEIARVLGWYRIPLVKAPKVIDVDYLAFYQPGSFGEHSHQIEFFAPVRGHELATREELLREEKEHPRRHEEYYKIQLGPLQSLANPIPAGKWKRITFFYTTGLEFMRAQAISDLVVEGEERKMLWQTLRERASQSSLYQADPLPESLVPDELYPFLAMLTQGRIEEEPEEYE